MPHVARSLGRPLGHQKIRDTHQLTHCVFPVSVRDPTWRHCDAVPEGFAVYEDPNGRLRLVLEADDLVTDAHLQMVRSALKSTAYAEYAVELVDEAIVIMQPDWTRAELARFLDRPATSLTADEIRDNTYYAPIMRLEPGLAIDGHYSLTRMELEVAAHLDSHLRDALPSDF